MQADSKMPKTENHLKKDTDDGVKKVRGRQDKYADNGGLDGFSVEVRKPEKRKKTARKNTATADKTNVEPDTGGLEVEKRVGKQKKRKESTFGLPSFGYTKKVRAVASRYGDTVFFVNGRHGVRVLGALSKICSVRNVGITADGVQFEVPSKHRGQIIAILNNLCYDYKIIKVKGAFPFAVNALGRLGFAVGIIVVAAAIAIFSQFVTRVSVTAADAYESGIDSALNSDINDILSSYGIGVGKWLPSVNLGDVEKSLLALDGVSYASVKRHGTHVAVEIKREQPPESLVEVSGSKVVSKKVAVVTRVIVEGGTAAVDYGDVVRAGDTLIDGYVVFGEDKLEVEAKGIVYGKVYYKKSVFFADTVKERIKGGVKKVTKLSMFGKSPKTPDSPFEHYELQTHVTDLGFLLPFKIYGYEFTEITEREYENTLTLDEMYLQVYSQIVSELTEPSKVLEKYCETTETDGGRYVTVTVEAEERIA